MSEWIIEVGLSYIFINAILAASLGVYIAKYQILKKQKEGILNTLRCYQDEQTLKEFKKIVESSEYDPDKVYVLITKIPKDPKNAE